MRALCDDLITWSFLTILVLCFEKLKLADKLGCCFSEVPGPEELGRIVYFVFDVLS